MATAVKNPYDDETRRAAQVEALGPRMPQTTDMVLPKVEPLPNIPDGGYRPEMHRDVTSGWGAVFPSGGDFGSLSGWDMGRYNDPNVQNGKYQAGRIFSTFTPRPSNIGAVLGNEQFKAQFPKAKQVGVDKIDFGDGRGPIDVLTNANAENDTASNWWWGDDNGIANAAQGPAAMPSPMSPSPVGGQSNLGAVMEEIQALANGVESPSKRRAVLDLLDSGPQPNAI